MLNLILGSFLLLSPLVFFGQESNVKIDTIEWNRRFLKDGNIDKVYVVYDMECPIASSYLNEFESLISNYSNSFDFDLIITPFSDLDKLNGFSRQLSPFKSILFDEELHLSKKLKLFVLPSVAVVNKRGRIKYFGAIDNKFFEVGILNKSKPKENYLTDALDALIMDRSPKIRRTDPVGCKFR